jgi:hypothetical protein
MDQFIRKATASSLVLMDELGSGTDPNFGGGIAQAVWWSSPRLHKPSLRESSPFCRGVPYSRLVGLTFTFTPSL